MMRRPMRVYADTSAFGGAFDEEFRDASRQFFDQVRRGDFELVTSPVVQQELRDAPEVVRELFAELLAMSEIQLVTAEVERLAQAYLDAGILSERSRADALHVALATIAGCVALVSWNFKHLVNFHRRPLYDAVNTLKGYASLAILSPPEVLFDEDEDEDT